MSGGKMSGGKMSYNPNGQFFYHLHKNRGKVFFPSQSHLDHMQERKVYLIRQETKVEGGRSQSELANKIMEIKEATTDADILSCFPTYSELRPHVKKEEFLSRVRKQQEEGFRIMFIKDPEDDKVKSILGFRTGNFLYSGKTLYVDDVATSEEGRGKGYAGALQDWVIAHAKENEYNSVSLDSGYGPTRTAAHRLYLNKGFEMESHPFHMHIKDQ